MPKDSPRPVAYMAKQPIHSIIVPLAATCLAGALLTDLTYWRTAEMMWADFSAWLVSAGVILGWLSVIAGLFDWLTKRVLAVSLPVWPWAIVELAALILATFNMFIHSRDAWTSVVPWGLVLSAATVVLLLVAGAIRWSAGYRAGFGVTG